MDLHNVQNQRGHPHHRPPHSKCDIQHKAPTIVSRLTGNIFHDLNDGYIPIFITINSIFPNQDIVLVISKARDWWVRKYVHKNIMYFQ